MVLAAYVAGLITPLAAFLGAFGGMWWWRRLRRAQSASEPIHLDVVEHPKLSPPSLPQGDPVLNRMTGRNVPARRGVRGRRTR